MKTNSSVKRQLAPVPKDLNEANDFIAKIGEAQRFISGLEKDLNDKIEKLKLKAVAKIKEHEEQIIELRDGVYYFAESRREELTKDGKKTVNLPAGDFSWKMTPKSVSLKDIKAVLQLLKEMKLNQFIRIKEEIDKEAMLKEETVASGVKGVTISQHEEFSIKPAGVELEITLDSDKLKKDNIKASAKKK